MRRLYVFKSWHRANRRKIYSMCALVPCMVNMTNKLDISRFGYISIHKKDGTEMARGHEFHYSKLKRY